MSEFNWGPNITVDEISDDSWLIMNNPVEDFMVYIKVSNASSY